MSKDKIKLAKQTALISGVFISLVGLLLIFNYIQISSTDPLESEVLKTLVERLSAEPNNEALIGEIRQYDLLARKAYFNSLWQIHLGAYLLLAGSIVLVIALRILHNLKFSIDKPTEIKDNYRNTRSLSQRWIAATGVIIIVLALLSAFLSTNHIKQFQIDKKEVFTAESDDGIERIVISSSSNIDDAISEESAQELQRAESSQLPQKEAQQTEEKDNKEPTREVAPSKLLTAETVWQNHNSFRGPFGNAISKHRNIPTQWDGETGENIIWKTEIPIHGYNSPVIWEDKIFFSGANESKRVVYCIDRKTGEFLWEREVDNISGSPQTPPKTTDDTGLAAPTLTVDGHRVYALFGTGDIIALDLSGNRIWARNLGVPDNHYGHSSSLITWEGKLFVQYDTHSGSRVMALDVANGTTTWETIRTSDVSWASPILANVNGTMQLILQSYPDLSGYDISTGNLLWSVNCMSGEVGPSPAYGSGLVFAANEYATMVAVDPTNGEEVWRNNYYLPEVSSLLYHNGLVYLATTFAVFACFDAKTGEFIWEFDADEIFYSSPMVADDKIYIFDTKGKAYIFKPGREPNLISSPELGEKIFATPIFSDGRLYIRGNKGIYCIGNE